MNYDEMLGKMVDEYKKLLKANLVGIYVHGSMAFNCFNSNQSDIDLVIVIDQELTLEEKVAFMNVTLKLNGSAPKKGLELSVVLAKYCKDFRYPTPYELHFSNTHIDSINKDIVKYCNQKNMTDKDLAAHFTVIDHAGLVLSGKPIKEVFGTVPKADFIDSIKYDIEDAETTISEYPVYVILNLCRVLAFLEDGPVLSKSDGGRWGLKNIPEKYHILIDKALKAYEKDETVHFDDNLLSEYSSLMLSRINSFD
ncbi:MAG TPA: DUF4111 domain-containing protein [Candidatus Izemoplasmatales bacterium]|nr:DUF4111 domain-containing protein [Candidatus Izemoplasmatales bacterium]